MSPTLLPGDLILAVKPYGVYGTNGRTLPFHFGGDHPQRGDVVLFRADVAGESDRVFVKRVIAGPGDRIDFTGSGYIVNGAPPQLRKLDDAAVNGAGVFSEEADGRSYTVALQGDAPRVSGRLRVPEGYYFVMGDNRHRSTDSRMFGAVREDAIFARAWRVLHNPGVSQRAGRAID